MGWRHSTTVELGRHGSQVQVSLLPFNGRVLPSPRGRMSTRFIGMTDAGGTVSADDPDVIVKKYRDPGVSQPGRVSGRFAASASSSYPGHWTLPLSAATTRLSTSAVATANTYVC
jgi:hypothetical protein